MMRRASHYHMRQGLVVVVILGLLSWGSYETYCHFKANALQDQLLAANTAEVPAIVKNMEPYRPWLNRPLQHSLKQAQTTKDGRKELHASLALLPVDPGQVDYLYRRLLEAQPQDLSVIREALVPNQDELLNKLWSVVEAPPDGKESQRLRAAAALAKYTPESEKWTMAQVSIADDLVTVPPIHLSIWMDALRPVRRKLLPQLSAVYRDAHRQAVERSLAMDILGDYAADDPTTLATLLMDADENQFGVIFSKLKELGESGLVLLHVEIDKTLPDELPSSDERRETLAKRQANAAVALLRMNMPENVWPLLSQSPDPRVRSYLIHRFAPFGVGAQAIIKRLDEEPDPTSRRALILSLGEFNEKELPPALRRLLLPKLKSAYRTEADAGLHAAVEWLMRSWQQDGWLDRVGDEWKENKEQRDKQFESIKRLVNEGKEQTPKWYVNCQGQTMVAIFGPVEFLMGSPASEKDRSLDLK
jgi:hypothetical protein